jgi:hypothetical protein
MKEIIRHKYRRTFNFPPTAKILANVPNFMFLDDHDVRDDWGWRPEDWDPTSKDYLYGRMA